MEDEYAIGLDLGTTFSCIGVYRNDWVEIIPNRIGEKITPSVVIITNDSKILVGEETNEYLVQNYDSCIYEVKRLIGKQISEKERKELQEKFPFQIVTAHKGNFPEIKINNKGKEVTYSPVEISSYIIKKMVFNAEKYLKKAINQLVITVPAYFSDSQRALTRQAAEALGLKVLRIINEPTAAALAYGFDEKQKHNSNILIFDLGGGTFDVSILALEKDQDKNETRFEVLGTSGDTNLGGEDFDNALVELVLKKYNDPKTVEKIRKDKQAMKRLKVACENAKKLLSISDVAHIRIYEVIKGQKDLNILDIIRRNEFEIECQPLFNRLFDPIQKAIKIANGNAKAMNKGESDIVIDEVILVGGSTRIPKIKELVKAYFPDCKINDSINPDEAIAYGATIEAEKILHPHGDKTKNFSLLDVTPFSLGTDVKNNSKDPEVQKEGLLMDVIVKRGDHIPISSKRTYTTSYDNQTSMSIDIYEGEKKYIKYNHLLKKSNITNLTKRPEGKTKVEVILDIDVNGILNVTAKELSDDGKGQVVNLVIKNDEVSLTNEEMEKLKTKMKTLLEKIGENEGGNNMDYINIKGILKKYYDAYEKFKKAEKKKKKGDEDEEEDEEDDGTSYLINYYTTLEEFIDKFDKNFDNETVLFKFYLYIKDLFQKYLEALKEDLPKSDREHISKQINKYIEIFVDKSSGYLNELLEILSSMKKKNKTKKDFYKIIAFVIIKLTEFGKTCVFSGEPFCKYHSIIYFEQSNSYFEKYFPISKKDESEKKENPRITATTDEGTEDRDNIANLPQNDLANLLQAHKTCLTYLRDINSGAILLCEEFLKKNELIGADLIWTSSGTGFTKQHNNQNLEQMNRENQKIYLENYEKILSEIQVSKDFSKKEALCIANIIKINSFMSNNFNSNSRYLLSLANRCLTIVDHLKLDKSEKWYLEFEQLYNLLKKFEPNDQNYQNDLADMKSKYPDVFKKIDDNFNRKNAKDFIKFIIKEHPYKEYEKDKDKKFDNDSPETLRYLLKQYLPDNYKPMRSKPETILTHCIVHEISKKLNYYYSNIY